MRHVLFALASVVAAGQVGGARADDFLQSGSYRVDVQLLLPHVEDLNSRTSVTVCLTGGAGENASHGFVVLSTNNPLAHCPSSNVRRTGAMLSFDIVCPGHNQAQGWASYQLAADRFQGSIEMKMGGKNMTMTETQIGHRVGACAPAAPPRF